MRKLFLLKLILTFSCGALYAGSYYDATEISTTTQKATKIFSGDIKVYTDKTSMTTSYMLTGGSITLSGTVDGVDVSEIPSVYLSTISATSTYLEQSSATATYLQLSSATATYLEKSPAQSLDTNLFIWSSSSGSIFAGHNYHPTNVSTYNYVAQFGSNNSVYSEYSSILGGSGNKIFNTNRDGSGSSTPFTSFSTISGGYTNYIYTGYEDGMGNAQFIGGGLGNETSEDCSVIGGGFYNDNTGDVGFIGAGAFNKNYSNSSSIVGGWENSIGDGGFGNSIGGGTQNNIAGYQYCSILGGSANYISTSTLNSNILGGQTNSIMYSHHSSIVGGNNNKIGFYDESMPRNAKQSFIGGGYGNNISTTTRVAGYDYNHNDSIIGGYKNTIVGKEWEYNLDNVEGVYNGGTSNTILGGMFNKIENGRWAIVGGRYATASSTGAVAIGENVTASVNNSFAFGRDFTNDTTDYFAVGFDEEKFGVGVDGVVIATMTAQTNEDLIIRQNTTGKNIDIYTGDMGSLNIRDYTLERNIVFEYSNATESFYFHKPINTSNSYIDISTNVVCTGSMTATNFYGNGSFLTGISAGGESTLQVVSDGVEISSPTSSINFNNFFTVTEPTVGVSSITISTTALAGYFYDKTDYVYLSTGTVNSTDTAKVPSCASVYSYLYPANYSVCISTPYALGSVASLISPFRDFANTISSITVTCVGGTNVIAMIEQRAVGSYSSAGTDIWSGDVTALTTGWIGGTSADFTIPANYGLFLVITSVSGNVDRLMIKYTITRD